MFLLLQSACFFLFVIQLRITAWSSVFPGAYEPYWGSDGHFLWLDNSFWHSSEKTWGAELGIVLHTVASEGKKNSGNPKCCLDSRILEMKIHIVSSFPVDGI